MTGRSNMAAMVPSSPPPPQFGQGCMSMSMTRLSNFVQLIN
jgi:hypothetical protein